MRLLFDGEDVTGDRRWLVSADLDDGVGVASSRADLDRLLVDLTRAERASRRDWHRYYLALHEWNTDELMCHWPARGAAVDDMEALA